MMGRVFENVSLKHFCTYRVGGAAKKVVKVFDVEGLKRVLAEEGDKVVIGRGSKVLFGDDGFDGVVVIMSGEKIKFENNSDNKNAMSTTNYADSGVFLPKLAKECAKRGLSGLEWAVGIPASVGGAVWMNAGAHGGDMKKVVSFVEVFRNGEVIRLSNDECGFSYRKSFFKKGDVVLGACFRLEGGDKKEIEERMREFVKSRRAAQPLGYSCGSVFKSVEDGGKITPAWVFIDACTLKGIGIGGAVVSEKHANFIVNTGDAKAEDIKTLIRLIKAEVYIKFGVMLEEEVVYI